MHIPPIVSDDGNVPLLPPTIFKDRYLTAISHLETGKALLLSTSAGQCSEMEEWRQRYLRLVSVQASLQQALNDINFVMELSVSAMTGIPWDYLHTEKL